MTARRPPTRPTHPRRAEFGPVLRSEWTKFRSVRGWVIGVVVIAVLGVGFTWLVANGKHQGVCNGPPPPGSGPNSPGSNCSTGHPFVPTGPNGEAVADSYQFLGQPLTGNGTVTARVSSLTGVVSAAPANVAPSLTNTTPGLAAWAKAGILLTPSTRPGSPYAAVMATGSHGFRWQYNYVHDQPGTITNSSSGWLRLTRTGNTVTGYDSADGRSWYEIGTAHLAALPASVTVGLFVTSPASFQSSADGVPTQATATFDHVTLNGHTVSNDWRGRSIGAGPPDYYPTLAGSTHRSANAVVVSGSGDIAVAVNPLAGGSDASGSLWFGLIVGLIMIIVIATMFITVEYRRGLIRTTFIATPRRGSVLAAKAVVVGVVAFGVGALAAAVGIPLGEHLLTVNGNYIFPAGPFTELRIIVGSGALVAATAVGVVALGTILRKSAGAVAAGIVVFVLPYVIGSAAGGSTGAWLFRLTPAAGFDVLGTLPRAALVSYPDTLSNGYYPLSPWAGLAVLCAYAALALAVATSRLRHRDP